MRNIVKTTRPITNLSNYAKDSNHLYMLLSRLQQDCEYYLGYGNKLKKHLWALDEKAHINEMLCIYNYLSEKPEWLSMDQILEYREKMGVKEWARTRVNPVQLEAFKRTLVNRIKKGAKIEQLQNRLNSYAGNYILSENEINECNFIIDYLRN